MNENKTFVGEVLEAILSIFKSNWLNWIVKLWSKVPKELKVQLTEVVEIVNRIKTYVDSPVVDLITFAIPGDADDKAVAWLRSILKTITEDLRLEDKITDNYSATDLHNIGTLLTKEITGMSYGQSAITIENAYQNS